MEMDEMKTSWNVLNEKLQQNEILNKRLIREMIASRTQTAYGRLWRYNLRTLMICFFWCLFFLFFQQGRAFFHPASLYGVATALIMGALIAFVKMYYLSRFKMDSKKLCELTELILKYKKWNRFGYTFGTAVGGIVILLFLYVEGFYKNPAIIGLYVLLFCVVIPIACRQIQSFNENIATIQKGLKELEDIEKE